MILILIQREIEGGAKQNKAIMLKREYRDADGDSERHKGAKNQLTRQNKNMFVKRQDEPTMKGA